MLKNYLIVALRNFKRDLGYNLLNILGLTIAVTFSAFLIFYIRDELSFDRFHANVNRIYRINALIKEKDKDTMHYAITPFPLAPALAKDYPEVEQSTRLFGSGRTVFKSGDNRFYEDKAFFADSNVFRVFSYPLLEGDPNTALVAPKSVVLTQSAAIKYFGRKANYTGLSIQNDKGDIYRVTGITKDVPGNSHLRFDMLISRSSLPPDFANNWGNFGIYTYVLLKPNTNIGSFEKKLLPIYEKYFSSIFAQFNVYIKIRPQNIADIHLHSDMQNEPEELGSMSYIYIFGAVALFMLIIASINYMNLTTARSARRAKEIGVRKVTGSSRSQLVAQFMVESILTALLSLLLALGLIALFLPAFNGIAGKSISRHILIEPGTLLLLLAIALFVGLLSGSYPAFYLSKFNPVNILKGSLSKSSSNIVLRRVLVVVQFTTAMIMLICTWVVYAQLKYLRNKDLGFSRDQVVALTVNSNKDVREKIRSFKTEIRNYPQVAAVSTSEAKPGDNNINFNLFSVESKNGFTDKGIDTYAIDEYFFTTLGMKIAAGRNFTGLPDTTRSIIVNQEMAKYFGWAQPLGKRVKFPGDTSSYYMEVVGVVSDFNQKSLYNPIAPLLLLYRPQNGNILIKLSTKDIRSAMSAIEKSWKNNFPDLPFQYNFLDNDFDSQYAADQKRGKIFTAFSALTILITCLGLLGLVAFTTQQRQKEISIRKILGASPAEIVPLLTRNFALLVGISCLLAFPVAYIFMKNWLSIFPYNSGLTIPPFLFSALAVLVITLLTVIFHSMRAALASPVKNLRTE